MIFKLSALQTMCRVTISGVPQSISNFSSKLLKKAFYLFANLNINKKKKASPIRETTNLYDSQNDLHKKRSSGFICEFSANLLLTYTNKFILLCAFFVFSLTCLLRCAAEFSKFNKCAANLKRLRSTALAEDRNFSWVCRLQGQELELRCQGQGLQNVFSKPKTSSGTPSLL